jgi:hypothetical protein
MTSNPILFLDIDGVLNSQLLYERRKSQPTEFPIIDLDPTNIKLLNKLIEETYAKVVISSSWRLGKSVEQLQSHLETAGFVGEIIGKTKDMRYGEDSDSILRGNEILCWMKDHPAECGVPYYDYTRYVIFDDDSDMLYWQKDNFIKVDPYCGLTPNNIFHAKKILK